MNNIISNFDEAPRPSRFADALAKAILSQTDSAILYHCLMELIGEIDADTSIISNLAYSDQVSESLSDLSYMLVQIRRGEGDMDGEGVANYMRKAISLGWTEDRFVRLVTTLDERFKVE